ncbi:MAG: hypothetical protein U5N85_00250 [Arcicella sp.]|nr:hypothetical protein [Arcicella sp.]
MERTFTVPFNFNNIKPTAVSITQLIFVLEAMLPFQLLESSGTVTWYGSAAGTSPIGTGGTLSYIPSAKEQDKHFMLLVKMRTAIVDEQSLQIL